VTVDLNYVQIQNQKAIAKTFSFGELPFLRALSENFAKDHRVVAVGDEIIAFFAR